MATAPELHEPHIAAARTQAWHQAGEALLTLEAARTWLNDYGLLLFAPRGNSLGAPAPSLVEATLGEARPTVVLAETDTARTLTARLVGEGSAVPLNLLGGPGDLPDFLVSAQVFPFIFTLRGDKGWKRTPETSGAVKVTPLGLRVYELLTERGALTIADITSEIGREVTESAIARALTDLWQMLRVLPVLQQGEGDTLWELTTARYLKGIKAGANAGQPTALSALASLYLTQAFVGSEEEIAAFLSPLTARSRVRDVLHGLVAGRQLAEGVINGKAVLYMPDALPDFSAFAKSEVEAEALAEASAEEPQENPEGEAAPERIRRFDDKGKPGDRNLRGKPVSREGGKRPAFRTGAGRPPREDRGGDRPRPERRTFSADRARPASREGSPSREFKPRRTSPGFSGPSRPSFNRPWDEERAARPPRGDRAGGGSTADESARPLRGDREGGETRESRPSRPFSPRSDSRPPRRDGDRPYPPRKTFGGGGEGRPDRSASSGDRPQRPFRPRTEEGSGRPFRPRPEGGNRPFRPRPEGGDRPFRPRTEGGDRPFRPRTEEGGRSFRPRPEGGDRPFRPRPEGGDRPFRPRTEASGRSFRPKPEGSPRPFRPRTEGGDRPFRPREGGPRDGAPRENRGPGRPPAGGFSREGRGPARPGFDRGSRPAGAGGFRPAFKKGPSKFAGKPAGTPFAGKPKPQRPARKPRPEDEA